MLSAGSITFICLVKSELTGVGHSKLLILISMVISIIASLGLGLIFLEINYFSLFAGLHGFTLLMMWIRHKEIRSKEIYFYYFLAVFFSMLFFQFLPVEIIASSYLLNSALILGVINYMMILGHYYLVVPKVTVKPLLVCLRIYWAFLLFKIYWLYPFDHITSFWQTFYQMVFLGNAHSASVDVSEIALIFFQQIAAYIANPIISFYAYRLCQLRSTQSATGLFYVMVFFALITEMLSLYLLYSKGLMY